MKLENLAKTGARKVMSPVRNRLPPHKLEGQTLQQLAKHGASMRRRKCKRCGEHLRACDAKCHACEKCEPSITFKLRE